MGPFAIQLWLWILMEAVYSADGVTIHGGKTKLNRGQLWTTSYRIQESCKCYRGRGFTTPSLRTIQDIINRFKERGMVRTAAWRRGMVVTVCNYDSYNIYEDYEEDDSRGEGGTQDRNPNKKGKKESSTDSPDTKVYPAWTRDLLDEWEDEHDLPSNVSVVSCLDTFDKLERIDKHPVPTIQRVVRRIIHEMVPKYIRTPTKLRKLNKDGDEQTFKMYLVMFDAKSAPERDTTVHAAIDTESWKREL